MPQKYNRLGKHLGWEDLSAMYIDEMLEHLETWYDIVDIKLQDVDITNVHEPPITTKGDPYLRNCLFNKNNTYGDDFQDNTDGSRVDVSSATSGSVMRHLTLKEVTRLIAELQGGGGW
jgi:hypothetical protein